MKYAAADGKLFDTAKECRAYEKALNAAPAKSEEQTIAETLSEVTQEDVLEALKGQKPDLGKILEAAGRIARNARYAKGEFKARPKAKGDAPAEAAPPVPPPPASLPQAAE